MPGLPGDHAVERPPCWIPILESAGLDLETLGACECGHLRIGFDAEHREPAVSERLG